MTRKNRNWTKKSDERILSSELNSNSKQKKARRLAEALRVNLKKRKNQMRKRVLQGESNHDTDSTKE